MRFRLTEVLQPAYTTLTTPADNRAILKSMKPLQRFIAFACILAAPVTHAAEKPAGNAPVDAKKSAEIVRPGYRTAQEIKAMSPCKATVEEHRSCYSILRTDDGKQFSIGSPTANLEVVQFLRTLKNGQTYEFPSVFIDYQKNKK